MTDLISRADAIDGFYNVKVHEEDCTEYDIGYNDGIDYAISKLSVMPSAEAPKPTGELISRADAIDALGEEPEIWNDSEEEWAYRNAWVEHISAIKSLTSADRPTGEWIECESNHVEKIYLCSNCHNYEAWGEAEKTPYCPNCGAKMGGNNHD